MVGILNLMTRDFPKFCKIKRGRVHSTLKRRRANQSLVFREGSKHCEDASIFLKLDLYDPVLRTSGTEDNI
jgi:hypothetical protein